MKKIHWRKVKNPVQTAPRNCRFLSLVEVKRVLSFFGFLRNVFRRSFGEGFFSWAGVFEMVTGESCGTCHSGKQDHCSNASLRMDKRCWLYTHDLALFLVSMATPAERRGETYLLGKFWAVKMF